MALKRPAAALLSFAGHDPLGSAGIVADAKTFVRFGFLPFTLASCLTVQDLDGVHQVRPVDQDFNRRAFAGLRASLPPGGLKVGLLPDETALDMAAFMARSMTGPVVCDPVLFASGGQDVNPTGLRERYCRDLFPLCTAITPNCRELALLCGEDDPLHAARRLLERCPGLKSVVVTGLATAQGYADLLVTPDADALLPVAGPKRQRELHGTGCHYSSALLCALAAGQCLKDAVGTAQDYTAMAAAAWRMTTAGPMDLL